MGVFSTRLCVSDTFPGVSNTRKPNSGADVRAGYAGVSNTRTCVFNTSSGVYDIFPGVSNTRKPNSGASVRDGYRRRPSKERVCLNPTRVCPTLVQVYLLTLAWVWLKLALVCRTLM